MRSHLLVAVAAVCAVPAAAQSSAEHAASFGIFAGGTRPTGRITRLVHDPGYHVGALAQLRTPARWLDARLEGAYHPLDGGTQSIVPEFGRPPVGSESFGPQLPAVPVSLGVHLR